MKVIAHIHTEFPTKFGIPRQSGIIGSLQGTIVFEPEYRSPEAVRGLEEFSHLWLLWEFSEAKRDGWSPTVRPPRLGGNVRKGVFATRSPFRPNPIGLSSVRLERIETDSALGPVLHVSGADLMDGTPIYDIKPYIVYTDSHPEAVSGFAVQPAEYLLDVTIPEELLDRIPEAQRESLIAVLAHDPRPQYQDDPERVYGMEFAGMEVRFVIHEKQLNVINIITL
ncbi:MAG: tRNA (N6-threonylcarbamoyladenosine(37)-N6)-methyltransferase TrmO [Bacteroidales bacterium]|nr:tRNA (N6-threonylcarbamoyladenosine(37)-N6)-methyltransferase TrmO [Bacteroidales bacterium]